MTSSQTLHLGSYVHSLHCDTPLPNLHLGLHIHSPPWTVLPRFVHRVTCPHSPGDTVSLDPVLWYHDHSDQKTSQTWHLGSQVYGLHGKLLPDPVPEVTYSQSPGLPHPRSGPWVHMFTVSLMSPSQTLQHGVTYPYSP